MDQNFMTNNYNMQSNHTVQMQMYEQQMAAQQRQETERRKAGEVFGGLAVMSLIYALVYTLCLYKNTMGITVPVWVFATICYANMVLRAFDVKKKRDSIFLISVMGLLGISTFLTGNESIIRMNYCGIFLLLVALLLHNFAQDERWDIGNYLSQIIVAVAGAISYIGKPISDGSAFYQNRRKKENGKGRHIAIGVGVSIVCVFFLGLLLMSADMVFENMLIQIFWNIQLPSNIFGVVFMIVFGFFSSYCGVRFLEEHGKTIRVAETKKGEPITAIIITASIAALYLVFCMIQIIYLFVGGMKLPEGVTYANYARHGFFQLLFGCMLNLLLVLLMKKHFGDSKVLNAILLVICGCTFVMTASSALRMILYIEAYQLTFLRVFVLVALFTIALLMAGVVVMILKPQFSFFRYALVTVSVVYLAFSFSHVDYFIADYNLSHSRTTEAFGEDRVVDYSYVYNLSTDAAPAIASYMEEHAANVTWLDNYLEKNEDEMNDINIRNFNVSHYIAHCIFDSEY